MKLVADYVREIKIDFMGGDSAGGPRFKIDVSGNWVNTFPANGIGHPVTDGTYLITFNEQTKNYTAVKDGKETEVTLVGADSAIPFKSDVKIKKLDITPDKTFISAIFYYFERRIYYGNNKENNC
jgi:hypothetical protein